MTTTTQLPAIIPLPVEIKTGAGEFVLNPATVIVTDEFNRANAEHLRSLLAAPTGLDLPIQTEPRAGAIRLSRGGDAATLGREGYRLTVTPDGVWIESPEAAGVFYGIQSLRQLLPVEIENHNPVQGVMWRVPCVAIRDWPRFMWRGHMLDVGRHFHEKATVLRTLDLMALQKLNVFHLHLTEDQGWRIEIKRYPRLTEVGAWRKGTAKKYGGPLDGVRHGGFFTREDIREIVAYAAERHIMVVPEIEMPGHSLAALAAYPELSCNGGPFEVATGWGIFPDIYCAGKESTFAFLQNVLDEVMELFPAPFIHIGGDEAPKARWKKCPDCQRRIREEGLKNEHALQVYLTNRIAAYLSQHGRRLVGWCEILEPGLADGAVPQFWVGRKKALIDAVRAGRQVVNSEYLVTYLDHHHALTPLSMAYGFDPIFHELDSQSERQVMGLEAPLWSEYVPDLARLDFQTYPRLTAFAECGWTPRVQMDFAGFKQRLDVFLQRLDIRGVMYARGTDVEPGWLARRFGMWTIGQMQTKTNKP